MRMIICLFLVLNTSIPLMAEYRVYVLAIENSQTQKTRTVKTTLDPLQYKRLYPLSISEKISYLETWKCNGSTAGYKIFCSKN